MLEPTLVKGTYRMLTQLFPREPSGMADKREGSEEKKRKEKKQIRRTGAWCCAREGLFRDVFSSVYLHHDLLYKLVPSQPSQLSWFVAPSVSPLSARATRSVPLFATHPPSLRADGRYLQPQKTDAYANCMGEN